jgi:hypothetical protein
MARRGFSRLLRRRVAGGAARLSALPRDSRTNVMRRYGFLLIAVVGLSVVAPSLLSAAPAKRHAVDRPALAASHADNSRYRRPYHDAAPYGDNRYADELYPSFGYYGAIPRSSYYSYYQTYGCYAPDRYCVYYNW